MKGVERLRRARSQAVLSQSLASTLSGAYVLPVTRDMSSEVHREPVDDPLSSSGSEPLVPILRADDGQADPVALATWHEALTRVGELSARYSA